MSYLLGKLLVLLLQVVLELGLMCLVLGAELVEEVALRCVTVVVVVSILVALQATAQLLMLLLI